MDSFGFTIGYSFRCEEYPAQIKAIRTANMFVAKAYAPLGGAVDSAGPGSALDLDWEDLSKKERNAYLRTLINDLPSTPDPGDLPDMQEAAVLLSQSAPAVQKTAEAAEKSSTSVLKKTAKHNKFSKAEEAYVLEVLSKPLNNSSLVVKVAGEIIRNTRKIMWSSLALVHPKEFPKRKGKDLRELWERRLKPSLKLGDFTEDENNKLRAMAKDIEYKPKKGTAKYSAIGKVLDRPDHMVRYQMIYLGLIEKVK
ncbi:MAG: hypothetical protein S4CHLAM37_01390 [Chlamydiia bacterium]|nr:hypothetical protein [Chlamydiia bacterium]